jgi:hypothetical protein
MVYRRKANVKSASNAVASKTLSFAAVRMQSLTQVGF